MFSGIVEETGILLSLQSTPAWTQFTFAAKIILQDIKIGDSIAVNGICLTVIAFNDISFTIQAVPETLQKTTLNYLKIDQAVNLERAVLATTRLGGHMVQGHVDTYCQLISLEKTTAGTLATFTLPQQLQTLIVEKGYVTLDGMSLTVVTCNATEFTIAFIPHTIDATIVQHYTLGQKMNLEVDIMGKYIQRYLSNYYAFN